MTALIIGGTSGLGLALALELRERGDTVFVTGRQDPGELGLNFFKLEIGSHASLLAAHLTAILQRIDGPIDLLIYSAGFMEHGILGKKTFRQITELIQIGFTAPILLVDQILERQAQLPGVILITSTSQLTPRHGEEVYAAAKAGLGMFGRCISLDSRVGKVLVAAPAGMDTEFWDRAHSRAGVLLDPVWVAGAILEDLGRDFMCKTILYLRDPPHTKLVEEMPVKKG